MALSAVSSILDTIRIYLDDVSQTLFDNATLLLWINEAVQNYCNELPITKLENLVPTRDGNWFALPTDFRQAINVYCGAVPYTPDRKICLAHMKHCENWENNGPSYDIVWDDHLDTDRKTLITNFNLPLHGGQSLTIHYYANHHEITQFNTVNIPINHIPIIYAYVVMAAARQREFTLAITPQPSGTSINIWPTTQAVTSATKHWQDLMSRAKADGRPAYIRRSATISMRR
jgi:hypothetical protein